MWQRHPGDETLFPFLDFGGSGQALHFLHANGYPPACYRGLIERLKTQYHVCGMLLRPLWGGPQPESVDDWGPFSRDLLGFLQEQATGPVIGVGHSIGAIVTLRAAIRQPRAFRALILIEPVLFPPTFILRWRLIRALGLADSLHPLIRAAQKRRHHFDDLALVFEAYRQRNIFRYFDDEALWDYINGIVHPVSGGGYELAFSPEWEARIYETGIAPDIDLWRALPQMELPILIIRGAETDTFHERTTRRVRRIRPQTQVLTLARSTHLVPLERPQETSEAIFAFLKELR